MRADEENRSASRHQSIDLAGYYRSAAFIPLRHQTNIAKSKAFAQLFPLRVRQHLHARNVLRCQKRGKVVPASSTTDEEESKPCIVTQDGDGAG